MIQAASCAGVVLAGGKSARMGTEKAALRIGDETLLARIVRRLRLALPEVYVVGPLHLAALTPGTAVFPDDLTGIGSTWRAVHRARPCAEPSHLRHGLRYAVRRAGVDARYGALCGALSRCRCRGAADTSWTGAVTCGLCASMRVSSTGAIAAADGKSLSALLERLNVKELPASIVARYDPSGRSTFNANSPEDWREALAIYAEESSASSEWM